MRGLGWFDGQRAHERTPPAMTKPPKREVPPAGEGPLDGRVIALVPKCIAQRLLQEDIEARRPPTPGPAVGCGNCRFWYFSVEGYDEDNGHCRRYPPAIETDDGEGVWYGPRTCD